MKFCTIMMTCGYVESGFVSELTFASYNEGFATAKEAVTELALDMYAKYTEEHVGDVQTKKCCKAAKQKEAGFNFCPKCGSSLFDADSFDEDVFMEMIVSLHNATNDTYGEMEYANERDFAFRPYGANIFKNGGKDVVCIPECAEEVLLLALSEAMPDVVEKPSVSISAESAWDMIKEKAQNEKE